ncbi:Alpha/Beta hydrolase protein [Bombardia bombarda]|uniref:Alpha/Beta hydrolase protein n=1 Tax=Bombardia bombarda TaxID=252184 RepID=A0AA39XNQ7_9PEZI|nr:Alpha/Beta hydrolase protein [Bombardia bombarda]
MAPQSGFPDPLVIAPLSPVHKQTFILLHGRGSSAANFGPGLLQEPLTSRTTNTVMPHSGLTTLQTNFPHAKFIFPTAPRRRATIYKRSIINQWFDSWHVDEQGVNEWLMIEGLQKTVGYLHALLRKEIALLGEGGAQNVVLGGISQGCAASLVVMLLWDGPPLGAVLGVCGWLPFEGGLSKVAGAQKLELDEAPPDPDRNPFSTPVFLGHGTEDQKVPVGLGLSAAACLETMGIKVSWNEYHGLGHWYSGEMLADMASFLEYQTKWIQQGEE